VHAYTGSGAAFRSERTFYDGRLSGNTDLVLQNHHWIRAIGFADISEVSCLVHVHGHASLHISECHHFPLRGDRNA
jgi:hypothetical protein